MSLLELILISFALSMDAFAVSVTNGACLKETKVKYFFAFGTCFGFFQFLMPLLGYLLAFTSKKQIENFDHWIAFILLGFLGLKMFLDTFKKEDEKNSCPPEEEILKLSNMVLLGIATSIDAMVVGISLAIINTNIIKASSIIGIVSFFMSGVGVSIGSKVGILLKENAERVGGIILILIGLKILLEHTIFI